MIVGDVLVKHACRDRDTTVEPSVRPARAPRRSSMVANVVRSWVLPRDLMGDRKPITIAHEPHPTTACLQSDR